MGIQKEVLICKARVIWRNPDIFPKKEEYLLVNDGKKAFLTEVSLKELAEFLVKGIFLSESIYARGQKPRMIYEPEIYQQVSFVDGYFGRPSVPHAIYVFSSLKRGKIKTLEKYLAKEKQIYLQEIELNLNS